MQHVEAVIPLTPIPVAQEIAQHQLGLRQEQQPQQHSRPVSGVLVNAAPQLALGFVSHLVTSSMLQLSIGLKTVETILSGCATRRFNPVYALDIAFITT